MGTCILGDATSARTTAILCPVHLLERKLLLFLGDGNWWYVCTYENTFRGSQNEDSEPDNSFIWFLQNRPEFHNSMRCETGNYVIYDTWPLQMLNARPAKLARVAV